MGGWEVRGLGSGSWMRGSGFGVWVWDSESRVRVYALGLFLRLGCRRSEFWGFGVSNSGVVGEGLGPGSIRPPETQPVAGSVDSCFFGFTSDFIAAERFCKGNR